MLLMPVATPRAFVSEVIPAGVGSVARPIAAAALPTRPPAPIRRPADPAGPGDLELIRSTSLPAAARQLTGYVWPLPKGRLTLPFGATPWGTRLVEGKSFHDGIDLATFCGDRIVAAHAGRVLAASRRFDQWLGWQGSLSPYTYRLNTKHLWATLPIVVVIDDENGYRSIYAHFSRTAVHVGQRVQAGQLIGYEGSTGHASGCHLHYGLFSPLEPRTFRIEPDIAKRLRLPAYQTARIDPLRVLPPRSTDGNPPAKAQPNTPNVPSTERILVTSAR
jgi:murein DD-endopeptidase MepM/ murein hydrolase activator NlpD